MMIGKRIYNGLKKLPVLTGMLALCVAAFSPQAYAACSNPSGVAGMVLYNNDHHVMQYCDDTDWINMGPAQGTKTDVTSGLVAHWKLDETSGTLADSAGSNDGTAQNTPTYGEPGKVFKAMRFDGVSSEHVQITDPGDGSLDFGTTDFSYGMWLYFEDFPDPYTDPFWKGGSSSSYNGYLIDVSRPAQNDYFNACLSDGTNIPCASFLANAPELGVWYHVFVTIDRTGDELKTYLNGELANTTDISSLGDIDDEAGASGSNDIYIGVGSDGTDYYHQGLIDDIRIYNRALTQGEIASIYANGGCVPGAGPFVEEDNIDTTGSAYGIWSDGDYIFLGDGGGAGLIAYTFDGTTLTQVDTQATSGWSVSLAGDGHYIYSGQSGNGLFAYTFDGSNLSAAIASATDPGWIANIWSDGKYIFVADGDQGNGGGGVFAYTFDGTAFTLVASELGTDMEGVWSDGEFVYAAVRGNGINVYSFDGSSFTLVDSDYTIPWTHQVWGDGTYIYVSWQDGVNAYTFDGTTLSAAIDSYTTGIDDVASVWGDGTYIYAADKVNGIKALTFNGTSFTLVDSIDTAGSASKITGDGTYIYLSDETGGIYAYSGFAGCNCSNPKKPEGTVIYNYDYHIPQFCNGTDWVGMGKGPGGAGDGCNNFGDVCTDGTVYIGDHPSSGNKMYAKACDEGMSWSGSSCAGSRSTITWNNGTTGWGTTGSTSTTDGEANTTLLDTFTAESDEPYLAAEACIASTEGWRFDWYLPSSDELAVINSNRAYIQGLDNASPYWSSSESATDSAYNMTLNGSGPAGANKNNARYVRCIRTGAGGGTVSLNAPAFHWPLDEQTGTTAINYGSVGGYAAWDGGPTYTSAGIINGALNFAGTDDLLDIDYKDDLRLSSGTISAWVKTTNDNRSSLFGAFPASATDDFFLIEFGEVTGSYTDELITIWQVKDTVWSSSAYVTATRSELFDGNWHHIMVTVDGGARLYLDGEEKTLSGASTGNFLQDTDLDRYSIGGFYGSGTPDSLFIGQIDDFRIYDRVLSQQEADKIYQAGLVGEYPADCTSPNAAEGTLIYNTDHSVMQYCDGIQWRGIKSMTEVISFESSLGCVAPTETFTTAGTDTTTVPAGCSTMTVQAWGAGGGGGFAGSTSARSGGGGGGGSGIKDGSTVLIAAGGGGGGGAGSGTSGGAGGGGGFAQADFTVIPSTSLDIFVGGGGDSACDSTPGDGGAPGGSGGTNNATPSAPSTDFGGGGGNRESSGGTNNGGSSTHGGGGGDVRGGVGGVASGAGGDGGDNNAGGTGGGSYVDGSGSNSSTAAGAAGVNNNGSGGAGASGGGDTAGGGADANTGACGPTGGDGKVTITWSN